ncbi:hypothetical protein L1S32_09190 [Methanogenium sp. S4BF]|uniref:hypothetical protein n=1 Tax=Methanogenium sp. S4BF TaxID=1789226 RepID=UPI0024161B0B|nr:hypothetical protein [Methanogenium sp. S4BF]WFN34015.1 hypothetical protein L1S32_09190 [Methanogenium sp. S4BF]
MLPSGELTAGNLPRYQDQKFQTWDKPLGIENGDQNTRAVGFLCYPKALSKADKAKKTKEKNRA